MIRGFSRAAFRASLVPVVLAASAACTLQVGGGGKPSALVQYVGVNGLLADPAATEHRPSLGVTLDRLWAAKLVGVPTTHLPSTSMVQGLLDEADPVERSSLQVRWSEYRSNGSGARQAVEELSRSCATATSSQTCPSTIASVGAFLRVTRSPELRSFQQAFPAVRSPACPPGRSTVVDLFETVVCGKAVEGEQLEAVLAGRGDDPLDSAELWAAAAVASASGAPVERLRREAEDALGRSQVQGVYFDEVPAQGTLLTTWALLHLARADRAGLDIGRVTTAIRREDTGGAPDRVMLARAGLALLQADHTPARAGRLRLEDPEGPYNPFIALAARDAGDLPLVAIAFSESSARRTPTTLASWAITQRIVTGRPVALTAADTDRITALGKGAPDDSPVRLLAATALAAGGAPGTPPDMPSGCGGAGWLVSTRGTCDIRTSLLLDLYREFTTRQGT